MKSVDDANHKCGATADAIASIKLTLEWGYMFREPLNQKSRQDERPVLPRQGALNQDLLVNGKGGMIRALNSGG